MISSTIQAKARKAAPLSERSQEEEEDGVEGSIEMESVCSHRGKTNRVAGAVRLPSASGSRTTDGGSGEPQRQRRLYNGTMNALSSHGSTGSESEALSSVLVGRSLRQETGASGDREDDHRAMKKQLRLSCYPDDRQTVACVVRRPTD